MRRFFVPPENILNGTAELQEADAHHLRTVMRLRPGDAIVVFDGTGMEYQARIRSVDSQLIRLDLESPIISTTESKVDIVLGQGFLKEKKMDDLIRPLSELGVNRWIPVMAHRSVPTPDPQRLAARRVRWQKISLEALKQCRRNRPMAIDAPMSLETVLRLAEPYPLKLIFWENEPHQLNPSLAQRPSGVFMLIGPEGGFEEAEVQQARAAGFKSVGLGPRILRAETAALSAAVLVQFLWGDMGSQAEALQR